ncbi:centrosomin isoform X6 [Drosophila ficusphila]|uniref:centrosomin isoform X6 n=1 Tax=Drosophila ficusphila TaxID=30025 RepID=UPI0007E7F992|nr:centrosomin isoform X6 [Drosophila ficusphila]
MNRNRSTNSHNTSHFLNASFDAVRPQSGNHSPMAMQGRPVRELEEQMSSLRKENFNLKLRIYFMEEGQPGNRTNNSSDSLSKQLIDAKIEIEMLRKTVDEKMELLKDAARAISHHEDVQRKAELESQMLIEELQEQIRSYQLAESSQAGGSIADPDTRKIQRLESEMKKLEDELQQVITQNTEAKNEMEFALAERLETITACEAKIRELAIKNAELVERLEKDSEIAESSNKIIEELKSEIGECRANNQDLVASISSMDVELVRRSNSMKEVSNTMDVQRQTIQLLEGTIKSKEKSNARLLNSLLEFEALTTKQNAELEIMRQQNVYFRDLSDNLQQKELRQSDRGVAIVQPMPTMTTDAAGVGIKSSLDRCGSTSSLHSNFSSISVLCGSRGPSSRKTLCHWNGGQQQQQHHHHQAYPTPQYLQQRGHRHGRHTTLMAVSAPSTAFYNYSLPSFTGFRQFLWRWGT